MIIIVISNSVDDYQKIVDRAVDFFYSHLSEIEYIDLDRCEQFQLSHFIFLGKMNHEMCRYANDHHNISEKFLYCYKSKNDKNDKYEYENLLRSLETYLNKVRIDFSVFNRSRLVFCTSSSRMNELEESARAIFREDHLQILYDEMLL